MGTVFSTSPVQLDFALLEKQNAETSNVIIEYFYNNREFDQLSKYEGELTKTRDEEDGDKLQKGIDYAKSKNVIDPNYVPESYITIDVLGKTPDEVAETILSKSSSKSDKEGVVIVIVGLSGTGKGTTVSCLREKLQTMGDHKVVTWSNGNIFRSVTLLAATWCEQQQRVEQQKQGTTSGSKTSDVPIGKALTKEHLAAYMKMLSFGKFRNNNTEFDTCISGLGLNYMVSDIENTILKSPKVSKNIPTVAEVTQGEVILFAADAISQMQKDGITVLLEGREQTVNYVRSPYRFNLILSDDTLIGKRRAAQRLMGETYKKIKNIKSTGNDDVQIETIEETLVQTLQEMVNEIPK